MAEKIHWGILSTGNIASKFAEALKITPDAELVAVGSRSQDSADAFAAKYDIPHAHGSYEALANDRDVDAVYIGTPHPLHKENTLMCIANRKAVLCEKPFAMNAADTHAMIAAAREKKVFLMEAMWTRFLPTFVILRQMLKEGVLGEVLNLQVNFGFRAAYNPTHRLFAPELGGGALLDLGIYNLSLASLVFGQQPQEILSRAHKAPTGVDDHTSMLFTYPNGASANMMCSFLQHTPIDAYVIGTEAFVHIHPRWFGNGGALSLTRAFQPTQFISAPIVPNGYQYEALEVGNCMRAGRLESDVMPLDETLAIMQTSDRVQQAWG